MKNSEKQIILDSRNDILDVIIYAQNCMISCSNSEFSDNFRKIVDNLLSVNVQLSNICLKK